MTAPNHALTGALIGLSVANPLVAVPLAFLSHFVCDALPHFDVPGATHEKRMASRLFLQVQILAGAGLCFVLVAVLAGVHPRQWLLAAVCAFVATIPDLLYIPRYLHVRRTGRDNLNRFWFWKFHSAIQWFQRPIGGVVEAAWFVGAVVLLSAYLR